MSFLIFALCGCLLIIPGQGSRNVDQRSSSISGIDNSKLLKLLGKQSLQLGGQNVRASRGISPLGGQFLKGSKGVPSIGGQVVRPSRGVYSSPYSKGVRSRILSGGGFVGKQVSYQPFGKCGHGRLLNALGECEQPEINRKVFIFDGPDLPPIHAPPPKVPAPKVDYNVVFVRTPNQPEPLDPIVVPPPKQKTLLYVLTKNEELEQKVIEAPEPEEGSPEVIYVNYGESDEDENTEIYGSLTLKDILTSLQNQDAKVIHIGSYEEDDDGGDDFGGGDDDDDDDDDEGEYVRTYSRRFKGRRGGRRGGYRSYGSFEY